MSVVLVKSKDAQKIQTSQRLLEHWDGIASFLFKVKLQVSHF